MHALEQVLRELNAVGEEAYAAHTNQGNLIYPSELHSG
jgi:hypothetical protein